MLFIAVAFILIKHLFNRDLRRKGGKGEMVRDDDGSKRGGALVIQTYI